MILRDYEMVGDAPQYTVWWDGAKWVDQPTDGPRRDLILLDDRAVYQESESFEESAGTP